jgi:hypothetical protein
VEDLPLAVLEPVDLGRAQHARHRLAVHEAPHPLEIDREREVRADRSTWRSIARTRSLTQSSRASTSAQPSSNPARAPKIETSRRCDQSALNAAGRPSSCSASAASKLARNRLHLSSTVTSLGRF